MQPTAGEGNRFAGGKVGFGEAAAVYISGGQLVWDTGSRLVMGS